MIWMEIAPGVSPTRYERVCHNGVRSGERLRSSGFRIPFHECRPSTTTMVAPTTRRDCSARVELRVRGTARLTSCGTQIELMRPRANRSYSDPPDRQCDQNQDDDVADRHVLLLKQCVRLETGATHLACTLRSARGRYDVENASRSMPSAARHTFAAPGPKVAELG